jgi:hypothetical protein
MYLAMPFASPRSARFGTNRAGMSLLEVLVALGVLAGGLASVAALLPAAGARLADATAIDQAGALAANTQADLRIRNVLTASMFSGSSPQAVVSGSTIFAFASGSGTIRVETRLYPTISVTEFDVRLGVSGTMTEVKDTGVCCGVLVVPVASTTTPIAAGMPARVSVATFKKSNVQSQQITLTAASGSASVLSGANPAIFTTGSDAAADSLRKQFLGSCAWVLASSTSGTSRPAWLQIGSSWTTTGPTGLPAGSYVSFSDPTAVGPLLSGSTLSVYGFTHILRVDERPATLR